jgi:hypothetical protein
MTICRYIELIKQNLTPAMRYHKYANSSAPLAGYCYVASEALYHLMGGKSSGLIPQVLRLSDGQTHWYLKGSNGVVYDPTAEQFDNIIEYTGRPTGYLTKTPSKRTRLLLDKISQ